jgi:hypothetical protein
MPVRRWRTNFTISAIILGSILEIYVIASLDDVCRDEAIWILGKDYYACPPKSDQFHHLWFGAFSIYEFLIFFTRKILVLYSCCK